MEIPFLLSLVFNLLLCSALYRESEARLRTPFAYHSPRIDVHEAFPGVVSYFVDQKQHKGFLVGEYRKANGDLIKREVLRVDDPPKKGKNIFCDTLQSCIE